MSTGSKGKKKATAKSGEKKAVHWNEAEIAEHDKTRGTRMKIEEPKTPHHGLAFEDEDGAGDKTQQDLIAFQNALLNAMENTTMDPTMTKEEARAAAFEEKRRKHYNEFEMLKKARGAKDGKSLKAILAGGANISDDEDED